jgi:hypothetical protein
MAMIEVRFRFERETKGALRYHAMLGEETSKWDNEILATVRKEIDALAQRVDAISRPWSVA